MLEKKYLLIKLHMVKKLGINIKKPIIHGVILRYPCEASFLANGDIEAHLLNILILHQINGGA